MKLIPQANTSIISDSSWADYWQKPQSVWSPTDWQRSIEHLVTELRPHVSLDKTDVVLDIGCGYGYLAKKLEHSVNSITCIDISADAITHCQRKFSQKNHIEFKLIEPQNYTNLSFLKSNRYSRIFCVSVLQYYHSLEKVAELLKEMKRIAKPGAIGILADVVSKNISVQEIVRYLWHSIRTHQFLTSLRLLGKLRLSDYYHMVSRDGFLVISEADIRHLCSDLNIRLVATKTPLTLNPSRNNYLLYFP